MGKLPVRKKMAMIVVTMVMALIVPLLPPALYIATDATTRLFLSDEPSAVHFKGTGKAGRTIMYVGGAGSSPLAQSAGLVPALQSEGDNVVVIENATELFNAQKVIDLIIRTIAGQEDVVFVVGSMGGLIIYDVIKLLRERGDTRHFGVVLIDTPANGDDVIGVPGLIKVLARIAPLGWITNLWFPSQFDRNAPAVIDRDDVNWEQLEALWGSYETWKASSWRDQGVYTFSHGPMAQLSGVTWYFVKSGSDEFVSESAYTNWVDAQGPMLLDTVSGGEHLALLNRRKLYNGTIVKGVRHVAAAAA